MACEERTAVEFNTHGFDGLGVQVVNDDEIVFRLQDVGWGHGDDERVKTGGP